MPSFHRQIQLATTRSSPHSHILIPRWRRAWCNHCRHGSILEKWTSEAVFGSVLATIGTLVALKYQCKGDDPFEKHPMVMILSVLAMPASFSASTAPMVCSHITRKVARMLAYVSVLSGALALILLGSIVLQKKFKWAAYLLFGFPWALLLIQSFKSLLKWVRRRTVEAVLRTLRVYGLSIPLNRV